MQHLHTFRLTTAQSFTYSNIYDILLFSYKFLQKKEKE